MLLLIGLHVVNHGAQDRGIDDEVVAPLQSETVPAELVRNLQLICDWHIKG